MREDLPPPPPAPMNLMVHVHTSHVNITSSDGRRDSSGGKIFDKQYAGNLGTAFQTQTTPTPAQKKSLNGAFISIFFFLSISLFLSVSISLSLLFSCDSKLDQPLENNNNNNRVRIQWWGVAAEGVAREHGIRTRNRSMQVFFLLLSSCSRAVSLGTAHPPDPPTQSIAPFSPKHLYGVRVPSFWRKYNQSPTQSIAVSLSRRRITAVPACSR